MPLFCKVMFVVSLFFCLIRGLMVALTIAGLATFPASHPALKLAYLEIISGVGMMFCGMPANGLLLVRNYIGFYLGWGLVVFTIASIVTAIVGLVIALQHPGVMGPEDGQDTAFVVGGTLALVIRTCLIMAYISALLRFHAWYTRYGSQA